MPHNEILCSGIIKRVRTCQWVVLKVLKLGFHMPLTCSRSCKNTNLLTQNVVNRLLESNLDSSIFVKSISSCFMLYTELGMEIFVLINKISGFVFMIMKF